MATIIEFPRKPFRPGERTDLLAAFAWCEAVDAHKELSTKLLVEVFPLPKWEMVRRLAQEVRSLPYLSRLRWRDRLADTLPRFDDLTREIIQDAIEAVPLERVR